MIVFGKNVFNEILENRKNIRKIYLSQNFHDNEIMQIIKKNKLKYISVNSNELNRLTKNGNHQGIALDIDEYNYYSLVEIIARNDNFIVILDHLEDPHNLGAIIRTCEAAGVKSIIIPKDRSVQVNETVMKTSVGALEYVNVCRVNNLVNAINELKDNGYFVYGTKMDGKDYRQVDFADKVALVIGNEGKGISKLVSDNCDEIVKINMIGKINSLNASVSTAILIYGIKKDL